MRKPGRPHLSRWAAFADTVPAIKTAVDQASKARSDLEKGKKAKRTEVVDVVLPNAVPGKVVVRFGEFPMRCKLYGDQADLEGCFGHRSV